MNARRTMATAARAELNRDVVVDRALEIAESEGLDAVAIRRLATDLGVTPMALYWHVANKEQLLEAMGDRIFDGTGERATAAVALAGRRWVAQLRAVMDVLIDALRTYPSVVDLAAVRIVACEDGRVLTETALEILRAAGLSVADASNVGRQALLTAIMLVNAHSQTTEGDAEHRAAKEAALRALPADRFPRLNEAAAALTDCEDDDAFFASGVDLFVAGVEALARRARG